jgi:hypothetical protein
LSYFAVIAIARVSASSCAMHRIVFSSPGIRNFFEALASLFIPPLLCAFYYKKRRLKQL